jgi:CubicO group peptidase (beta-lactamase class C family)
MIKIKIVKENRFNLDDPMTTKIPSKPDRQRGKCIDLDDPMTTKISLKPDRR